MILKKVVTILLLLSLSFLPIFRVNATDLGGSWAQATAFITKEYGLDLIGRSIARNLLNKMISGLITKVQGGGRDGGPAFVQNWRNFQTEGQYRGENVFRSMLASTNTCEYFGKDIKNLFGANDKVPSAGQNLRVNNLDPFTLRANCTMPSSFNINNYQNDFAGNGGWEAWDRLLEPQNNFYGTLFMSLDEAAKQRTLEESGDINEAISGSGYTSVRDSCTGTGVGAKCVFLGKVFTPGDLLGKTTANTIEADLQWLVSSDELSEVIISVITAAVNRLANLALSNPNNDYNNAPSIDDGETDGFNQCVATCNNDAQCIQQCSGGVVDWLPDPGNPNDGEGAQPPIDAKTKHGNHKTEVAAAKDQLISQGMAWVPGTSNYECNRFEITKLAAQKIGENAGLLSKTGGNNCQGYAVDIVAFPDGYIYDVVGGSGDGVNPSWNPAGCGPADGDGTCPERYRVP